MSEPIPESIPTSADPRTKRPTKKSRPTTAVGAQNQAVAALFQKQPDVHIPVSATRGPKTTANLPPPPEIVTNVQGSSAGAGSGEFHVYKAARRREYERLRLMEAESSREEADRKWEERREENRAKDEGKTSKNRKRREKAKNRAVKGPSGKETPDLTEGQGENSRPKIQPRSLPGKRERDEEEGDDEAGAEQGPLAQENGIVMHEDD